jgi:hypothetical protein
VVQFADPSDDALDPHAEPGVRDRAVLAQVEVPVEGFFGELVLLNAAEQQVQVRGALAAANDLAVPLPQWWW